jgi:1-phosphatidylinositol-4-phosphate 5-kinase
MTKQDSGGIVSFIEPMEGTEAHEALKANKDIKLSTMGKLLNKSLSMKPKFMGGMGTVKRKQKKFDKNFKGKVIDGKHELYVLSSGMMLGIRCAIGGSSIGGASGLRPETPLTPKDFAYTQHLNFPKEGSSVPGNITPPHSLAHSFKFKSYAPRVFGCIRSSFDIDVGDFMNSVCGNYNFLEFISNSKSGQFFFYSHDGKYMIKTQSKEENKFLMRILPQYDSSYTYLLTYLLTGTYVSIVLGTMTTSGASRILSWCACWVCTE